MNGLLGRLLLLATVVIFSGCERDPCKGIVCLNGGVCINGACDCQEGYEGLDCSKNPCQDVVCLNDGTCIDGTCHCAEGYEGADCSTEKAPERVLLTKVIVTGFPAFRNGSDAWDNTLSGSDTAPDIYLLLQRNGNLIYESSVKVNADPNNDHAFDLNPAIDLFAEGNLYRMRLLDNDGQGLFETIGEINFLPYTAGEKFPEMIELKDNNGVEMELYVEYVFD